MRVCKRFDNEGSSPLTRGKPENGFSLGTAWRLIPAHAGKTRVSERRVERQGAHPRSRGENQESEGPVSAKKGSSPLTRGKHVAHRKVRWEVGLIPAHAGKTRQKPATEAKIGAHPRSRGENGRTTQWLVRAQGSSPLTRGKRY